MKNIYLAGILLCIYLNTNGQTAGDYKSRIPGADFATNNTWEQYDGTSWQPTTIAPQNLPYAARPQTIYIDKTGVTAGNNTRQAYNNVVVLNGGALILAEDETPVTAFISQAKSLVVEAGGSLVIKGQVAFHPASGFIAHANARVSFENGNVNSEHPVWAGTENFYPGSVVAVRDWKFRGGAPALVNSPGTVSANGNGYLFGTLDLDVDPPADWNLVGTDVDLKLADSLVVRNASTRRAVIITSPIADVNVTLNHITHLGGLFSIISSRGASAMQAVNILGNLVSMDGELKIVNNTTGNSVRDRVVVNLHGELAISRDVVFRNERQARVALNFAGSAWQAVRLETEVKGIDMHILPGAKVRLEGSDLLLNTWPGKEAIFTVENGGSLNFGFADDGITPLVVKNPPGGSDGTNIFQTMLGSTLYITSPDGIQVSSASKGNVQLDPANKLFHQSASFWYIGRQNQVTGDALTNDATGRHVYVDMADDQLQLRLSNPVAISNDAVLEPAGGKLEIRKGILIGSTSFDFTGNGRLVMTGGEYRMSTTGQPLLPALSNYTNYELTGGLVHLNGRDTTQILASVPLYYAIKFSGTNTEGLNHKTIDGHTRVSKDITIAESAVVDAFAFKLGGQATDLYMEDIALFKTGGEGIKPDAGGNYFLSAGTTINFTNDDANISEVRLTPAYAHVIVSGSNVSNGSLDRGIEFQPGGDFTVRTRGIFRIRNIAGFSGTTTTAISAANNPQIFLQAGSTIEYFNNLSGGDQSITNQFPYAHLTLSGSGQKTAPPDTLEVHGNMLRSGNAMFAHNYGTVLMNGANDQRIGGMTYNILLLQNGGVKIATGNSVILDSIQVGEYTTLRISDDDSITLRSTLQKTAREGITLGTIEYGSRGKFVVERNIETPRKWQLLAIPTNSDQTIKSAWQEGAVLSTQDPHPGYGMQLTASYADAQARGFDSQSPAHAIKYWTVDEYKPVASTFEAITRNSGYMVYVRGDRSAMPVFPPPTNGNGTTLRTAGKLFTGTQPEIIVPSGKFVSVGNPYASAVDFARLERNNISNSFYVWDPKLTGSYGIGAFQTCSYNILTGEYDVVPGGGSYPSGTNSFIQSGQAFFVVAPFDDGSLRFKEQAKVAGSDNVFRTALPASQLRVTLLNNSGDILDGVMVDQRPGNLKEDESYVPKIQNSGENLSIARDAQELSILRASGIKKIDTVQLVLKKVTTRPYTLRVRFAAGTADLNALLVDKYLNTVTEIRPGNVLDHSFTIENIPASYDPSRFFIIFARAQSGILLSGATNDQGEQVIQWTTKEPAGVQYYEVERSAEGGEFKKIGSVSGEGSLNYSFRDVNGITGNLVYRVTAILKNNQQAYSNNLLVLVEDQPSIQVYPNPVTGRYVNLEFSQYPPGDHELHITSLTGQLMYKTRIVINEKRSVKRINLPASVRTGEYQLTVTSKTGTRHSEKLLVL